MCAESSPCSCHSSPPVRDSFFFVFLMFGMHKGGKEQNSATPFGVFYLDRLSCGAVKVKLTRL